jgi:phage FluMu protein Com
MRCRRCNKLFKPDPQGSSHWGICDTCDKTVPAPGADGGRT